uniref:Uncharacterized protein n=1 Tax=Anguilla anguilla TaxID=7936 RepID=A0A0E9Q9I7_ANGAN
MRHVIQLKIILQTNILGSLVKRQFTGIIILVSCIISNDACEMVTCVQLTVQKSVVHGKRPSAEELKPLTKNYFHEFKP